MPSDSEQTALRDIVYHIDLAVHFTTGLEYEAFANDLRTFYAATRCLEIVSEASRRLSDALKARHPSIPWRQIAGAGNVYRHDYEDVAASFVWATIRNDLPLLRTVVELELNRLGAGG